MPCWNFGHFGDIAYRRGWYGYGIEAGIGVAMTVATEVVVDAAVAVAAAGAALAGIAVCAWTG